MKKTNFMEKKIYEKNCKHTHMHVCVSVLSNCTDGVELHHSVLPSVHIILRSSKVQCPYRADACTSFLFWQTLGRPYLGAHEKMSLLS